MRLLKDQDIKRIAKIPRVLFFLDYDGTLTPIISDPQKAVLKPSQRSLLQILKKTPGVQIAMISGRELTSLKKMVRIPGIVYAGNHGLEIEGLRMKRIHPSASAAKSLFPVLVRLLKKNFRSMVGIRIENKTYSVTVHYRNVPAKKIEPAKRILLKTIGKWLSQSKIILGEGKKVWEIRPAAEWDKGTTLLWLFARIFAEQPGDILPVYIGDDIPDEKAFEALKNRGITIKATPNRYESSSAAYRVNSPAEVFDFLAKFIELRKKPSPEIFVL